MKLYLIKQNTNNDYDTFDSAVVAAENAEAAKLTHPSGKPNWGGVAERFDGWTNADNVTVICIGVAEEDIEAGVICASYNAG